MRRLLYIIVILFCVSAINRFSPEVMDDRCVAHGVPLSESDSAGQESEQESDCRLEPLNLNFTFGEGVRMMRHNVGGTNYSRVVSQAQRVRNCQKFKEDVSVNMESHPRHVTHLFNFDCVKSSMRVDYYLYTLCRLRI